MSDLNQVIRNLNLVKDEMREYEQEFVEDMQHEEIFMLTDKQINYIRKLEDYYL